MLFLCGKVLDNSSESNSRGVSRTSLPVRERVVVNFVKHLLSNAFKEVHKLCLDAWTQGFSVLCSEQQFFCLSPIKQPYYPLGVTNLFRACLSHWWRNPCHVVCGRRRKWWSGRSWRVCDCWADCSQWASSHPWPSPLWFLAPPGSEGKNMELKLFSLNKVIVREITHQRTAILTF